MAEGNPIDDRGGGACLVELVVADPPESWAAAGFTVEDQEVRIGATTIRLVGGSTGGQGITGWTLAGLASPHGTRSDTTIDGLPTSFVDAAPVTAGPAPVHPNGVVGLDHVVVVSPDLDRTIAAFGAAAMACRRIRDTTSYGSPMRQAFFRLGDTIVEAVSGDAGTGLGADVAPATWFGLALDVTDLDATGVLLGEGLGAVKEAVQEGRRIATLRHRMFAMSVAVAAMDDHADR